MRAQAHTQFVAPSKLSCSYSPRLADTQSRCHSVTRTPCAPGTTQTRALFAASTKRLWAPTPASQAATCRPCPACPPGSWPMCVPTHGWPCARVCVCVWCGVVELSWELLVAAVSDSVARLTFCCCHLPSSLVVVVVCRPGCLASGPKRRAAALGCQFHHRRHGPEFKPESSVFSVFDGKRRMCAWLSVPWYSVSTCTTTMASLAGVLARQYHGRGG
jgi:hypothetical protein